MHSFQEHESQFRAFLKEQLPKHSTFLEAASYALFSGAKRIRPWLCYTVAEAHGYHQFEKYLPFAAAIECIHTYSLIHDDLPCMDDDDYRRGRPSLHKQFGEPVALMTGSLLLATAFQIVTDSKALSFPQKEALLSCLYTYSGVQGLLGGQLMDIEKADDYEKLCALKTGALFAASTYGAALISKSEQLSVWESFGKNLGVLYQIQDDISDQDTSFSQRALHRLATKTIQTIKEERDLLEHSYTVHQFDPFLDFLFQHCNQPHVISSPL